MRHRLTVLIAATVGSLSIAVAAATLQNIAGTITNPDAETVQGIEVSFFDAANAELIASATTHGSGDYDSGHIPTGSYRLRFVDPSGTFQPRFLGGTLEKGESDSFCEGTVVPVSTSATTVIDAELRVLEPLEIATLDGPVSGTVMDAATGTPLQGIRVTFLDSWNATTLSTVVTDADGSFDFGYKAAPDLPYIPTIRIRFSDPTGTFFSEFYGAGSDTFCSATIVHHQSATLNASLERVPLEQLTQNLADAVQSYDLPASIATMLGTSLTQLRKLLADDSQGNHAAACAQLGSFVTRVDVLERRGELSGAEAIELRGLATNLRTVLGCQ
jgi:5-hydroxyisourate hydrolase-like protein (transthyretin family)